MAKEKAVEYGRKERYERAPMDVNPLSGVWGSNVVNWKSRKRRKAQRSNEHLKGRLRSKADTGTTLGTGLNEGINQMRRQNQAYLQARKNPRRARRPAELALRDVDTVQRQDGIVRPDEQIIRPETSLSKAAQKWARNNPGGDFSKAAQDYLGITDKDRSAWGAMHGGVDATRDPGFVSRYTVSDRPEHKGLTRGLAGSSVRSITQGHVPGETRRWIYGRPSSSSKYSKVAKRSGRAGLFRRYGVY